MTGPLPFSTPEGQPLPNENRNNPSGLANNVVDSLRGSPLVIGILALNTAFIASFVYIDMQAKENMRVLTLELMRDCLTPLRNPQQHYAPQKQSAPQNMAPLSLPPLSQKKDFEDLTLVDK